MTKSNRGGRSVLEVVVCLWIGVGGSMSWGAGELPAAPTEIYVSPNGEDSAAGTRTAPLATLERARQEVRARRAASPQGVVVWIGGGEYALPATFRLTAEDGGTADAPVSYRAVPGERPVLRGGRTVGDWRPWKGEIRRAELAGQGFPPTAFRQLFCGGRRQQLARYPNFDSVNPYGGGWAYADGPKVPMYQDVPGESRRELVVQPADLRAWARPAEVELFVFPRYNWWNNIVRLAAVDKEQRRVTLVADCSYPIRAGDRYYFQNALEELDAPGEWYLDEAARTVYFWPPAELAAEAVYVPLLATALRLEGTRHVEFRGLTIECTQQTAVEMQGAEDCRLVGCVVRHAGHYGGSGVAVSGGRRNGVVGCDIYEVGRDGIQLSGGDRVTLTSAEHYADNNYIHHTGVFYKQGVGIALQGVGHRATHNLIHDTPRMGILFSGHRLLIELNHIRHANLETEDTGAVYTGGRDWISSRGTVIRHNYFHDILGYGKDAQGRWVSPHFAWGIYLDDNAAGVDVVGNVVVRCSRAGLHLHNGRDNRIENNIFVDNGEQQFEYNGWRETDRFWTSHLATMIQGFESVAGSPAWRGMRGMELHPREAILPDGTIMAGNRFLRNIVAWTNDARLLSMRQVSFAHNEFARNLYFHGGRPVRTGLHAFGPERSENLAPNGDFARGEPGQLPADWQWQVRPLPTAAAGIERPAETPDNPVLRLAAAFNTERPRDNCPIVVSRELPLRLGAGYRLRARLRAAQAQATAKVMLQSYVPQAYFWASSPHDVVVGTEWTTFERAVRLPAPGDAGYHEQMKSFRIRLDFPDREGQLWVDDVQLHEVEVLDEFASWQMLSHDTTSVVADPRFRDPARDDYRLQEDSPAWQLGFQSIPWDQIGPYRSDDRASWPVVEAPGAREKPLTPLQAPSPR
ncbi:MAG: right-handed parallel beta-helix repeat-containing protein [Pirellulales bacterium]